MSADAATTRIAVLGLYRSGSTAVAGVLHRLGVNMGERFWADYYEPQWLSEQLRTWWNEPHLTEQVGKRQRVRLLRQWVLDREESGARRVGAKHPLLCLCGEDLVEAWGEETKFIRTYRPLEESIQSLVRLGWWPDAERIQQTLWDAVNFFLGAESSREPRRPHLRVDFADMMENPRGQIEQIVEYLGLSPEDEQVEAAVGFIRPRGEVIPAGARRGQALFSARTSQQHHTKSLPKKEPDPGEVKIAATMLSGNSQAIVADAVTSVIDWVDWLLLIDTGITDDTAKIVEELAGEKFRCVPFEWCNDFALARNTSLEEAASLGATWALTVDTDERMLFPGFDSLEQLRRYVAEHSAIISWLVSVRGGNYAKERLIRVPTHLCWRGRTHEALVGAADRERQVLPGTYFYELSKSPEAYRKKLQRDLPILEEETRDQPDNPRWWYYLGQTLEGLERTREAAAAFRKRAELDGWLEEAAWASFKAASCHSQLNEFREAIGLCAAGLAKQPGSPELAWLAGYCCQKLGENRDALYWSRMAIALGHVEGVGAGSERINFRHLPGWYEGPYDVLHWAYRQRGRETEARAAATQCDRARRKRIVDQAALAPPPHAKTVLFDLGAHHGAALQELKDHLKLDDTWEIHVFEPNPACQIKERLQSFDIPVQVHEEAVWIEDGTVKLQQQNHRSAQNRSPSDGRSDMDGWGSCLEELASTVPGLQATVEVGSVDFARVLTAYSADDYVVVKMDVEGAEFAILRHLIEQNVLNCINVLFIEWHARLLPDETSETRQQLERQLHDAGVEILDWT